MIKTAGQRLTLDKVITLPRRRGPKAARRCSVRAAFCLSIALGLSPITLIENASANQLKNHPDNLKLYALKQIKNWDQFECYNWLIRQESNWDYKARLGSHYGLGQMRNAKVARLDGRAQIRWHLRYIEHRYQGDACKALKHFERKNWH
jgi:hypothetical protein